jgi:hypothetical protein
VSKSLNTPGTEFEILSELKSSGFDSVSIRSFQLLHKSVFGAIGFALIPLHFICGQFVVFCQYSLITGWSGLDSVSKGMLGINGTALLMFWVGVLETAGRFHKLSRSSIKRWKKEGKMSESKYERKFIGRFCKSCKPLSMGLEGTFVIKRLSAMKFLRAVIKGTFRAVVTLSK